MYVSNNNIQLIVAAGSSADKIVYSRHNILNQFKSKHTLLQRVARVVMADR